MGTATFTPDSNGVIDNKRWVEGSLTLSASYATGGDTLPLASLKGLNRVELMYSHAGNAISSRGGASYELVGTPTAPLIKCWSTAGGEAANASNQAGITTRARFIGS